MQEPTNKPEFIDPTDVDIHPNTVSQETWEQTFYPDGASGLNPGVVPLSVGNDGRLVGNSPSTPPIAITLPRTSVEGAEWVFSGTFSATDADTMAWGSGTLTTEDGHTYAIGAGNTGNMAAKTYVYFDVDVSTTAFQTTTTAGNSVGAGKILIAVAQNATGEAKYMVLNDNQYNIDAANIVANSITANELSTSITYAGSIIIDSAGLIRSGQTAYNTGTGWWIGNDGGTPKLSIGDGGNSSLTWDGVDLVVNGYVQTGIGAFGGNGSDGALTVSSGTTTIDLGGAAVFIKNYTSISITGTGAVAFSNPHANGTIVILKSRGNVVLTSSATRLIDLRGIGAAGGDANKESGNNPTGRLFATVNPRGAFADDAVAGAAGDSDANNFYTAASTVLYKIHKSIFVTAGAGGGKGGEGGVGNVTPNSDGGRGGGGLIIECAGALNFTGTIDASGGAGNAAANGGGTTAGSGGGGGGAAGMVVILYNELTASSGTITATGGAGGAGSPNSGTTGNAGAGGGGAGSIIAAGGGGGSVGGGVGNNAGGLGAGGGGGGGRDGVGDGGAGGAGGASMGGLVAMNTIFA